MGASGSRDRAARNWIPCRICPFNLALCHRRTP